MQRIGIFGGTYNPPHLGHLNIVSKFIEAFELSGVLIIPTYVPPHKESPDLASAEDRLEMCRRTFSGDIFEVSPIEILRKGKSYTYDTLGELSGIYKDAEFYFLVGDDMITTLHEWRNPEGILKLAKIVSAVRSTEVTTADLKKYAENRYPEEYEAGRFEFLTMEPFPLSSTEIREKLKSGQSVKSLVTPETEEYILSRGLYHA